MRRILAPVVWLAGCGPQGPSNATDATGEPPTNSSGSAPTGGTELSTSGAPEPDLPAPPAEWTVFPEGIGRALVVADDFLVIVGFDDGQTWAERRALDGSVAWTRSLGGTGDLQDVAWQADRRRLVIGGLGTDAQLWLLDEAGEILGEHMFDAMDDISQVRVAIAPDGTIVCALSGDNGVESGTEAQLVRLTADAEASTILAVRDGDAGELGVGEGLLVMATTIDSLVAYHGATHAFAADGASLWSLAEDPGRTPNAATVRDGLVYVVGGVHGGAGLVPQGWLRVSDLAGGPVWDRTFGTSFDDEIFGVAARDGVVAVTGRGLDPTTLVPVIVTAKYTGDGAELWSVTHLGDGSGDWERGFDVGLDAAGFVYEIAVESNQTSVRSVLRRLGP